MSEEIARGQTVTARVRQDYKPAGVRISTFKLLPMFSSENEWRDNIYYSQLNKVDDLVFHVKPEMTIQSDWKRHALGFAFDGDFQSFASRSSEDKKNYALSADGRFDVLRNSFAHAKWSYANQYENRGVATSVFGDPSRGFSALKPTSYQTMDAAVGYEHKWNRIRLNLDNDAVHIHYENGIAPVTYAIIQNDQTRSRLRNETSLRFGYELTPSYEAFVKAGYNFIDYDSQFGADGYQRSSIGYRGVAGIALDFTGKLTGDIYVGYQLQDYKDIRLNTVSGMTGGVGLKWSPSGLTTIQTKIDRVISETVQGSVSGVLSSVAGVTVDHELLRNIILSANAGYMINDYQGGNQRKENIYSAGFNAKYLLNRHFFVKSGFSMSNRSSNIANTNYDYNSAYITLGTQF